MTQFVEGKAPRGAVTQEGAPKLLPRHLAFVDEYMKNGRNGTQAAIAAGYSPKRARFTASRLMATNGNVAAEINRRIAEYTKTAGIEPVKILEFMRDAMFADVS